MNSITNDSFLDTSKEIHDIIVATNSFENSQSLKIQTIIDVALPLAESMYRNIVNSLPLVQLQIELQESMEASAAELWNVCCSIPSIHANSIYNIKLYSIILLSIYEILNPNVSRCLINVSLLITLFANSITKDIKDVAKKCTTYLDPMLSKLIELDRESSFDQQKKKLLNEYKEKLVMLNLNFAVINNDFVLARSYEQCLQKTSTRLADSSFALECSRVLYNSSLAKHQDQIYEEARFLVLIAIKYLESITLDSKVYHQRYLHCYILLVKVYRAIDTPQTKNNAKEALLILRESFPNTFDIYQLYFEICDSENGLEVEDMLMQMVTSMDVAANFDKTIELLKQCVNKSFKGVNKCLDYLLTHYSKEPELCETIVVTKFVTNVLLCKNILLLETLAELIQFIQVTERTLQSQLSTTVKSSVVAIVWSQGMKDYKLSNYTESIKWLQLALSRLFYIEYSENQDRGKIVRAIQNNHFELGNYHEVISMVDLMDQEDKLAVLTQFNMFRSYLMLKDYDKAMECICRITEHDDQLAILTMAACILESKDKLSSSYIKTIFLKLVEVMSDFEFREDYNAKLQPHSIVFPACCRCAVVMYNNEFENSDITDMELLDSILELFQNICKIATRLFQENIRIFTVNDIEWLASKSYNLALACQEKRKAELTPAISSDFCKLSIQFIELISPQIEASRYKQLLLWKARANLLNLMFTCRINTLNVNEWNEVRDKCLVLKEIINKQNYTSEVEWGECLHQVIVFQFQAELLLGSVQNLLTVIDECTAFKNKITHEVFNVFVSLIMDPENSIAHHMRKQILRLIIDKSINTTQSALQIKLMITWIRQLFESCEQNFGDKEKFLLLDIYKLIKANKSEITMPTFEIEWLATTCWNFGIVSIMYVINNFLRKQTKKLTKLLTFFFFYF